MSQKRRNNSEPPYDGFFTSSIASANESTGYSVTVAETDEQAREKGELGKNPNATSRKGREKNGKSSRI